MSGCGVTFDEIGIWSEVKLAIIKEYAAAYSTILTARRSPRFEHVYIDGFSGAGQHVSRETGDPVPGSPLNALHVSPPFTSYFFIDLCGDKVEHLRGLVGDRPDVHVLRGDCNDVLMRQVFPHVRFEDYRRGLCLLDPLWEGTPARPSSRGPVGSRDLQIPNSDPTSSPRAHAGAS